MYQKGQYSKAFTKSGSTPKSSPQKMAVATNCKQFQQSYSTYSKNTSSAKVRKAPVLVQNVPTQTRVTVQDQNQTNPTKKWNVQKSLDRFVSIQTKKNLNEKAKGLDSAYKDEHTMHLMGTRVRLVT